MRLKFREGKKLIKDNITCNLLGQNLKINFPKLYHTMSLKRICLV